MIIVFIGYDNDSLYSFMWSEVCKIKIYNNINRGIKNRIVFNSK